DLTAAEQLVQGEEEEVSNFLLFRFLSQRFYFRQDSIPDFCAQAVIFLPFSHNRKIALQEPERRLTGMFCQFVGYAVLFRDGWLFPTNVKDGKTQECMRLNRGHIPFDDHFAVLTLPEY